MNNVKEITSAESTPRRFGDFALSILEIGAFTPLPIKPDTKRPAISDWTNIQIDTSLIASLLHDGYAHCGIGHRCGEIGGLDIDILDDDLSSLIFDFVTKEFFDGIKVMVRYGQRPKCFIPCKLIDIPAKRSSPVYRDSSGHEHKIEVLAQGQQVVLYGRHPDTMEEYEWENGEPVDLFFEIPELTVKQVDWLFDFFDEQTNKRGWKSDRDIKTSSVDAENILDQFGNLKHPAATLPQLEQLLYGLAPRRCDDYSEWSRIVGIVNFETDGSDEGLALVDKWSSQSDKYGGVEKTYRSFKHDQTNRQVATVRTLVDMYKQDNDGQKPTVSKQENPCVDDWTDPIPLDAALLPITEITKEMVPEPFRAWVMDAADRMQAPPDYLTVPLIVVCGSLIGTSCAIRPKQQDDWTVIPNLWGGIIGPPSTLKSPALNEAVNQTLGRLEAAATELLEFETRNYEANLVIAEEKKKALQNDIKIAAKKLRKDLRVNDAMDALAEELKALKLPEEPQENRYKTNDASIEKLVELLNHNPRGLLYFRDELIGLFKRMERSGSEQDRAFLLEAWNGYGSHVDDRITRGTVRCKNLCVSLLGGIQPDRIASYLHSAINDGENDGFVQRLQLMVYPDPLSRWKYIDRSPDSQAKERAYSVIERLAGFKLDSDHDYLRFSEDGQEVFKSWLTRLQKEKLDNPDEQPVTIEHLAKYRSLMPSLALIFHLVEMADGGHLQTAADTPGKGLIPVSKNAAEMAVIWCDYLESHARRIYAFALDAGQATAARLAEKIKAEKLGREFKRHEIVSKKWARLTKKVQVQEALDCLIDHCWLREAPIIGGSASIGRPAAITYQVNPKIFPEDGESDACKT